MSPTAPVQNRRRPAASPVTKRIAAPTITDGSTPSSTTALRALVSDMAPANISSMRPRGSPVAASSSTVATRATVVFSSTRLVASSPSAPMYPGTDQKSSM